MQQSFYKYLIIFSFFIQYFGIGAIAQITIVLLTIYEMIKGTKFYFSDIDMFLVSSVFFCFFIKLLYMPLVSNFLIFKFYWGFIFFFIFFTISKFSPSFLLLFKLTIIITIIESILINTIVPLSMMKNVPVMHLSTIESESHLSIIQRSYGLASSPTASATIIVMLLTCIYKIQREIYKDIYILMAALGLVLVGSGTGFMLLIFFIIIRYKLYSGLRIVIGSISIFFIIGFIATNDIANGGILMRLSGFYFEELWNLKIEQFIEVFNKLNGSMIELFFGFGYESSNDLRLLSDFGWIDFLECCGFFGIVLFILFMALKTKKYLLLPIFIVLIGYFHYPSLGSIPGQIVLGAILAHKKGYKYL